MSGDDRELLTEDDQELDKALEQTVGPLLKSLSGMTKLGVASPTMEPEIRRVLASIATFIDRLKHYPQVRELRIKMAAIRELALEDDSDEPPSPEPNHDYVDIYEGGLYPPPPLSGPRKVVKVSVCYGCLSAVVEED